MRVIPGSGAAQVLAISGLQDVEADPDSSFFTHTSVITGKAVSQA